MQYYSLAQMNVSVIVACMPSFSKSVQHHLPLYQSLKSSLACRTLCMDVTTTEVVTLT